VSGAGARSSAGAAPAACAAPAAPSVRAVPAASRAGVAPAPDPEAKAAAENFPVALRLLPAARRRDLMALYGFARLVDDTGDEAPGDRLAALDALEVELERAFEGAARHPVLRRLEPTLRERSLPRGPFLDLIEANRRDQRVSRYESFDGLLAYCALSANPVGRLVLHVFGAYTPERADLSDAVCSALQVIEHCQDVAEDAARGRVYLPADDLARCGCSDADLLRAPAPEALRRAVACQIGRARTLLVRGEPLLAELRGAARLAVSGFAAGGHAACDALERAGFDPNTRPVRPARARQLFWLLRLLARVGRPA